jgi:hypothetical protein
VLVNLAHLYLKFEDKVISEKIEQVQVFEQDIGFFNVRAGKSKLKGYIYK